MIWTFCCGSADSAAPGYPALAACTILTRHTHRRMRRCVALTGALTALCVRMMPGKIYLTDNVGWPTDMLTTDLSREGRLKALRDGGLMAAVSIIATTML